MDVIKITPAELEDAAFALQMSPGIHRCGNEYYTKEDQRGLVAKFRLLAAKLEADKREALEFIPAKGVQA